MNQIIICPHCRESGQTSTCKISPPFDRRHCILKNNTYYDEKGVQHNHGHRVFQKFRNCSNKHSFIHLNVTRLSCKPCGIKAEKRGYYGNTQKVDLYHKYTDDHGMRINSEGCCKFESDQEDELEEDSS